MQDNDACRRADCVSAAYVDAALTIARLVSVSRAELMLLKYGVPAHVIARVLHKQGLHRPHCSASFGITNPEMHGHTHF